MNNRLSHAEEFFDNDEEKPLNPVMEQPDWTIRGGSSIRTYSLLNDKRHVLTKDTHDNVVLWDILKVYKRKLQTLLNLQIFINLEESVNFFINF